MIPGIQLIGILFSIVMIYLTYVYYKRNNYSLRSMLLWLLVWVGVLVLISVPQSVYGLMQALQIERTADFFVMAGFTFFSVIIFYLYMLVKKNNQKVEELVRVVAFEKSNKKKR